MAKKKRRVWFESTLLLGSTPVSIEGFVLLFGGVGGGMAVFFLGIWPSKQPRLAIFAGPCFALFVILALTVVILGWMHTARAAWRERDEVQNARDIPGGGRDSGLGD
ncbi:MAG: hypothetical protein JWR84_1301 [Caulobacter sp.]|nr:hypothetical protein [Caulobacter sp.]